MGKQEDNLVLTIQKRNVYPDLIVKIGDIEWSDSVEAYGIEFYPKIYFTIIYPFNVIDRFEWNVAEFEPEDYKTEEDFRNKVGENYKEAREHIESIREKLMQYWKPKYKVVELDK